MAFTKVTADPANISKLSNRPNQNDGLSAAQLKGRFDKAGVDITAYLNDVLTEELERTTDGGSGADNIGATAVGGGTAETVQGILEEIDAAAVHVTDHEIIAGIKTFESSPIVPAPTTDMQASTKKYVDDTDGARKTYVDNLDALAVHLAGTETITGVKTFSASPIVPAPTTDTQASTKKYVDDADVLKVNITDIVNDLTTGGTNVPLSAEQGKTLQGEVGTLASLSTTEKGSLVGAINEVDMSLKDTADLVSAISQELEDGTAGIDDTTVSASKVWSSQKTQAQIQLIPKGDKGDKGDTGLAGTDGVDGTNGSNGTDGSEVQLQKSATHIQWKYDTDSAWNNLVALADIKGAKGDSPIKGVDYWTESDKGEIIQSAVDVLGGAIIGYVDEENNIVLVGGLDEETYTIKYKMEDDSLIEIGKLVLSGPVVNLLDTAYDEDLETVYNGVGYKEGVRVSNTDGGVTDRGAPNTILTGLIPLGNNGDVFHIRGVAHVKYEVETMAGWYSCWDVGGVFINQSVAETPAAALGVDENDDFTITILHSLFTLPAGTAYIRLQLGLPTGEVIITRNQLIE